MKFMYSMVQAIKLDLLIRRMHKKEQNFITRKKKSMPIVIL